MLIRGCQSASEAILIALACLAPWAFGAVEAWAEFVLFVGIFLLAILALVIRAGTDRSRALFCLPSVALGGLVLFAAWQTIPLSPGFLQRISPATAGLRAGLTPPAPERVSGDEGATVPLPLTSISLDREATQRATIRLAAGWVLFQAVLGLGLGPASLRRFAIALVGNAALLSLFSLIQLLSWNGRIYWVRETPGVTSSGPFVNHNHLAAYLNLGLGFALTFLMAGPREPRRGERLNSDRLWVAYAAGLIVVGVVASLARSAFVAMAVSAAVATVVLRPQAKKLVLTLGTLSLLVIGLLVALGSSTGYQERIASILESDAYSGRFTIWQNASRLIPHYGLWGTGLGSFGVVTSRQYAIQANKLFEHAENEYVEWLLEGGIVGFGLIAATVAGTLALGWRAWKRSSDRTEVALLVGAFFGILSLTVQSLGDFALHVPAVAIVAVILGAHLTKLGIESASNSNGQDRPPSLGRRAGSVLGALLMLALIVPVVREGRKLMQAETALADAGFTLQGSAKAAAGEPDEDMDALEHKLDALEQAVRLRPDWAEGHWRLGLIFLQLYSTSAEASLLELGTKKEDAATQANPLWLFRTVHAPADGKPVPIDELLAVDHVRLYLVPAARCFLEARRHSPLLADPHARLATLDYLLQGADPARVYAHRAFRLSGSDLQVLELVQNVAFQLGDLDLLVQSWHKILSLEPTLAPPIAEMAHALFNAEEIRDRIIPSSAIAVVFAERIYKGPEERSSREILLQGALDKLANEPNLEPIDRFQIEGRIWFLRDDRERARKALEQALAIDPSLANCRIQLIDWLIGWGQARAAYDQAMIGLYYAPANSMMQQAHDRAAEALAKTER